MCAFAPSPGDLRIVVPGALHTDITVAGLPALPGHGEDAYGSRVRIGPGGKSRNVAEMAARLSGPGTVAMLGRTCRDRFGLWRLPLDALREAGVGTDFVTVADGDTESLGIALVAVDVHGNRNASISNTVMRGFTAADVEQAEPLFAAAAANGGVLALSLELPFAAVVCVLKTAAQHGLPVILDPGGLDGVSLDGDVPAEDLRGALLWRRPFLVKPNEHEAERMSGVRVTDRTSARHAASVLREAGACHVLITHGPRGGYLFGPGIDEHLPAPALRTHGPADATGCGDQVLATLCSFLTGGAGLREAARAAIVAGTLQFHRVGVRPVAWTELKVALTELIPAGRRAPAETVRPPATSPWAQQRLIGVPR